MDFAFLLYFNGLSVFLTKNLRSKIFDQKKIDSLLRNLKLKVRVRVLTSVLHIAFIKILTYANRASLLEIMSQIVPSQF